MSFLVFISHTEKDDIILNKFERELTDAKIDYYIAEKNYVGRALNEKLQTKIRESQTLLAIYTPRSRKQVLVRDEIIYALGKYGITHIVLFTEDGTEVEGLLDGVEQIRFHFGNWESKVSECVKILQARRGATMSGLTSRKEDEKIQPYYRPTEINKGEGNGH